MSQVMLVAPRVAGSHATVRFIFLQWVIFKAQVQYLNGFLYWPILTLWQPDKMTTILQTTFLNRFVCVKIVVCWHKFCSQMFNNQYTTTAWDNGLVLDRQQAVIWVNTLRPRQDGGRFQTTLSNAFSWMKMLWFLLKLKSLLLLVQIPIFQHWFR